MAEVDISSESPEELLYFYLKSILKEYVVDYTVTFGSLDLLEHYAVGLYLKGSGMSDRVLDTGKYTTCTTRLTVNINTDDTSSGFSDGYKYCKYINDRLSVLNNKTVKDDFLFISSIEALSPANYIGRQDQGINKFSLNFIINYTVKQ